jgi:hypothetical protein
MLTQSDVESLATPVVKRKLTAQARQCACWLAVASAVLSTLVLVGGMCYYALLRTEVTEIGSFVNNDVSVASNTIFSFATHVLNDSAVGEVQPTINPAIARSSPLELLELTLSAVYLWVPDSCSTTVRAWSVCDPRLEPAVTMIHYGDYFQYRSQPTGVASGVTYAYNTLLYPGAWYHNVNPCPAFNLTELCTRVFGPWPFAMPNLQVVMKPCSHAAGATFILTCDPVHVRPLTFQQGPYIQQESRLPFCASDHTMCVT